MSYSNTISFLGKCLMKVRLNMCHTSCLTERPHVSISHGDKLKQRSSDLDNSFKLHYSSGGEFEVGLLLRGLY